MGELAIEQVNHVWTGYSNLVGFAPIYVFFADAASRVHAASAPQSYTVGRDYAWHPLQKLYVDGVSERRLGSLSKLAFGYGVFLGRFAGASLPLRVGDAPSLPPEGVPTKEYIEELALFEKLDDQGDGMRSFVGLLLHLIVAEFPIILIDEPEAFLHPPRHVCLDSSLFVSSRRRPKCSWPLTR